VYTVQVTVDNECGQGSAEMVVDVQAPTPEQPDLSGSLKTVNLTSVESGDVLTYTLVLHNSSPVQAAAILVDPIPEHTIYVPGSAQASDGGLVTYASGQLQWSGELVAGTPVLIEFTVEVQPATVGTVISNVAQLDDGFGHTAMLEASSIYNPGYRLSINDGALYTNSPTVTLRYAWDANDGITQVNISNDGGFGPAGDTTGWLPVDPVDPTYSEWVLATYGDLCMPRTVYAKFRNSTGWQYGPVQDDIIYDPDPPEVVNLEILETRAGSAGPAAEQNVIVRVSGQDANSGISRFQVSDSADFGSFSEFAATGGTTDIAWSLQPSGMVYVRAVDRAGNVSAVGQAHVAGEFWIYLPLTLRDGP
jgi:uncharacterized repeat protein (TIGR01451 family)